MAGLFLRMLRTSLAQLQLLPPPQPAIWPSHLQAAHCKHKLCAQTHRFCPSALLPVHTVGLHINLHDALGSDWEDSESEALEGDEGGELEGARPGKDRGRDKSVVVGDEVRAASEHTEHGRDGLGKAGQSRGAQSKRSVGQLEQRAKQGQQETPQQDRTLGHTESEGRTAGHAEGAGRTAGHGESAEKTAGRTESEKGAAGHAKSEESTAGQLEQRAKEGQQDAPQLGEGQRSGSSGGDAAPSAAAETSQQVDADAAGKGEGLLEGTQGALDQQVADGGRRRRPRQPSITNKEAAYQVRSALPLLFQLFCIDHAIAITHNHNHDDTHAHHVHTCTCT
eukprot:1156772-Pelagomonas_calceolata.AAC.26